MGDVAISIAVLKELAEQNRDVNILFISDSKFGDLIKSQLPNAKFIGYNKKSKLLDIFYLISFSIRLRLGYNIDKVADLHGSIRSIVLRFVL